ncbi:MAG: hypothetical protein ACHQHN_00050 [Sphingobacteriales bacterium]
MRLIPAIALCILIASCKPKVCSDPHACKVVDSELTIIEKFVDHRISPPTTCAETVYSLTLITGIESDQPGDDLGQPSPTLNDYKRWSNWYEDNKDKLFWDMKTQKVLVRK